MHGPVDSCTFYETFHCNFIDFHVKKKKTFSLFFLIFDMPRIPQNLRERANDMLNDRMTMDVVAMYIVCSTRAIRHLRQRFQETATSKWTSARSDACPRTPTCEIASKLLQLLLLTPSVHISTVHLPKLCAVTSVRSHAREGELHGCRPYVGCVLRRRRSVNRVNWARTHKDDLDNTGIPFFSLIVEVFYSSS
jgi:hypothetical protein